MRVLARALETLCFVIDACEQIEHPEVVEGRVEDEDLGRHERVRPISLLILWISEGLTQA